MANAAILVANQADGGTVGASSQELTMPASNVLTPHPSERWRSLSDTDYLVLDKQSAQPANVVAVFGLTGSAATTIRIKLSAADSTGAAAEVLDSGPIVNGSPHLDVDYGALVYVLPQTRSWRYARIEISDPGAGYVEAGAVVDGLFETFDYNFAPGLSEQVIDRSRVSGTASGKTLVWHDNNYRRVGLNLEWVTAAQRNGVIRTMDRVCGRRKNVLLITDTASARLPWDAIWGLASDVSPVVGTAMFDIFGKQIEINERV